MMTHDLAALDHDELPLDRLADRLSAAADGPDGPLSASLISGGRSNPTYLLTDGHREWVLRRPPFGTRWESSHDVAREARVMQALSGTAVPVPEVVDSCDDESVIGAPFYVMPRIPGRTLRTRADTEELTPDQRRGVALSLVDHLVELHQVEPDAVGLAGFGRPEGYLERQLRRWEQQWEKVRTPDRADASALQRALAADLPSSGPAGIVHGDYKLDNVLVAPDDSARIVALLDWELATLGDTLADVGYLVSLWDDVGGTHNPLTAGATAWEGFPTAQEMIERYAERRGVEVEEIGWYVAFANYKLAVILQQIHYRHLRGETRGEGFDDLGAMIDPLLEMAHDRMKVRR